MVKYYRKTRGSFLRAPLPRRGVNRKPRFNLRGPQMKAWLKERAWRRRYVVHAGKKRNFNQFYRNNKLSTELNAKIWSYLK